ncbi:MYND-type zinc finger-containing chromatin reader ZMYND8 isoform X1 [Neodiprion pinetum]|uniref:MYND-type zinc finger-containing chromatin reader ZMYND8 isoform X1 n=1 Tax=Neodiprion pinetum TaxID=441929 RepID=UPI001EDF6DB1|nr:protein kinase C-binding protein 1 isoform X1 [Neodiprion pinetum]XP_046479069.1 protein kinase C-binding protein 1 isoform X1 [Neodiprion pinetum]XP_046479070.1 protein kinase C-binding protein 1 isoform X1 [Neodiprion pinetum]
MILSNMESSEDRKNAIEDCEDQKNNSETAVTEKDKNDNESSKKSNKINNLTNALEQSDNIESKTNVNRSKDNVSNESDVKSRKQSAKKHSRIEAESQENNSVENRLDGKKPDVSKSTSEETQASETRSSLSVGKDVKINGAEIKGESAVKEGKRKRRMSRLVDTCLQGRDPSVEKNERINKRKRSRSDEDKFCWRCHKESVDSHCTACPRSWHRRCMGGGPQPTPQNWICGECATILKAENAETRSPAMAQLSVEQLCTLLRHVVGRMRDYPGSEPFWKAVDLNEVPNYLDYVVKPMDLSLLESNVRAKLYGSTEAFMADAKWIQHNCIVFNTCGGVYTDTSKLTNAARQIIKAARQEVSEIEACSDCYGHARNLPRPQPSWFIEPCRRPHPLVWAKLKGFPFWPAKAMSRINGQGHVDVRFFGAHDRAWVPIRDLFLYSEDPPAPLPRKRKADMDECVREITRHCRKLELAFGQFKFAPPKIQYNPRDPLQIKLMLPNYDPLQPSTPAVVSPNTSPRRKPPLRKRGFYLTKKSCSEESTTNNASDFANNSTPPQGDSDNDCEKYIEASRIPKVSLSNKLNKSKLPPLAKSNENQKVIHNSSDNGNFHQKKIRMNCNRSNTSNDTDNLDDSVKTDDDSQLEQRYRRRWDANNSSDGHSSSENEVSLEIRKSSKFGSVKSHKGEDDTEANDTKIHNNLCNETRSVQDSKIKIKSPKTNKNPVRVYKPKTRMVNQVNAERAKATASNEQKKLIECTENIISRQDQPLNRLLAPANTSAQSTAIVSDICISTAVTIANSVSVPNNPMNSVTKSVHNANLITASTISPSSTITAALNTDPIASSSMGSIFLPRITLLESTTKMNPTKDCLIMTEETTMVKEEPKDQPQNHTPKKESKARKSFLNKPPMFPQISPTSPPKAPASPPDAMVYIPGHRTESEHDHSLLSPEAGPLSAQLHRGGQELAKRMAQLMEEALTEAAQINSNNSDNSGMNQRATVHYLKLQIERMRWQHQQHLAELKHNTDLTLREMRASLEAERYRAIEETKREAEEEKLRSIEETKRKQWCALCGNEALFYCCWNTAYCDYPCQQAHWSTHMRTCAQNPPPNTIITATANVSQQQVMPSLVMTSPHASSSVWGA